ncbi:MAG: helix-turn-helix transcriptional regulator [Muribaculaceae bacterium]|nr:helix-turn-helix transcriptional regulator [Muribaculaceae bacterium]
MPKIAIIFITLVCALMAGCRKSPVNEQLDLAEALMEHQPDSALIILEEIDGQTLRGETQARHALLLSQAYDKNYIDLTSDSLISIAVNYFSYSDDEYHQMMAYHYRASIYLNANYYEAGMHDALMAYDIALKLNDATFLSRIENVIGMLYSNCFSYNNAIDWELRSLEHAKIAKKNEWLAGLYSIIGSEYYNLQRFHESIEYLDSATLHSTGPDIDIMEVQYLSNCFLQNYSTADSVLTEMINAGFQPTIRVITTQAEMHPKGALDSLKNYIIQNGISEEDINCDYAFTLSYLMAGDTDSALKALRRHIIKHNQAITSHNSEVLENARYIHERDKAFKQSAKVENNLRVQRISLVFVCIIISLIIFFGILHFRIVSKRHEEQIARTKDEVLLISSELTEMQANLNQQQQEVNALNQQVKDGRIDAQKLFMSQFAWIEELGNIFIDAEASKASTNRAMKDLKKRLDTVKTTEFIDNLKEVINGYCDNLIDRVKSECPSITDSERTILALLCANLSTRIISFILNITPRTVYNAKSSIKRKLENNAPSILQELHSIYM